MCPASTAYENLRYEQRDRVTLITIDRPERMNAIDGRTHRELVDAWGRFRDDDDASVAVLTGAGDRAFCAGGDLKAAFAGEDPPIDPSPDELLAHARGERPGILGPSRWTDVYKPTIAAVNGWALAGGLELALACDIRIASERARFGSFEARRGYHHGDGGIVRLVNVCGAGLALEMLLTAEPIDAQRALQANLVARVVPHDELMAAAERTAHAILRNSQAAVRSAKETILDVIGRPLDDQLRIEAINAYSCADPEDTMGRLRQFYEKTDPGRAP